MISVQNNIHLPDSLFSHLSVPERTYRTDPVSEDDVAEGVNRVLDTVSSPHRIIGECYFARGIQSYESINNKVKGAGPLADLYPVAQRDVEALDQLTKVGFHNQNIEKPSWEIHQDGKEIELLATRAVPVVGATCHDVPWLYVELDDNDYGYGAIVRSHTRGGIAPAHIANDTRVGVGYMTIYTLIRGQSTTPYEECD